ncbi:MAG: hypothetical protein JSU91_06105, partial [Thermoplasmatales archaeon]
MSKSLSKEIIHKIREEVLKGKSKYRVAKEMKLSEFVVYSHTSDLPSIDRREPCIKGKTLELLKQLMNEGYIYPTISTIHHLRKLKTYLPMIQRTQVDGKSIYHLSDKNRVALQAVMKKKHSKIISYQELKSITKIFGVNLDNAEKQSYVKFKDHRVFPIIRKKSGGFLSSNRKSQTSLDDFDSKIGLFGKNEVQNKQKIQSTISNLLQEIDDSLVELHLRMYWDPVVPKVDIKIVKFDKNIYFNNL